MDRNVSVIEKRKTHSDTYASAKGKSSKCKSTFFSLRKIPKNLCVEVGVAEVSETEDDSGGEVGVAVVVDSVEADSVEDVDVDEMQH